MSEYRIFKTRVDIALEDLLKEEPILPKQAHVNFSPKQGRTGSRQSKMMLISIITHSGCRFAEALGLTIKDIHSNYINIDKTWDYKDNSGFAKTKNLSSIRKVSVDTTLIHQLQNFFKWKTKYYPNSQDLPLIIEPQVHVFNDTMNEFFKSLQKEYGVKDVLSIHKMRHTYISYLLNEGISAEFIAKQVGHTDTSMIQHVYGHLMRERQEADKMKVQSLLK